MSKPTIVCVPGAWHTPEGYENVFKALEPHGYPTIGLPLPSVGASPALLSFDEDVEAIRDCLRKLIEEDEKEVVLVVHSYSGMPGTEAPVSLGKKEREAKGLKGGVTRLVYIMAFAPLEGFTPTAGGRKYPDWMRLDAEVGTAYWKRLLSSCSCGGG
jgi:pimeloyl-ACP methyl ester carboxylesterase